MTKNACKFAGDFDCHKDAAVRCRAHCPMEHIQRFTQSHWMLPLGKKCLHRVAPATATVVEISGKHKNTTKTQLLELAITLQIIF
jgi:hypothetical protein